MLVTKAQGKGFGEAAEGYHTTDTNDCKLSESEARRAAKKKDAPCSTSVFKSERVRGGGGGELFFVILLAGFFFFFFGEGHAAENQYFFNRSFALF